MNIYTLTQKDFDKTNKALSEALGLVYTEIQVGDEQFFIFYNGWGGKTKGTTGYKYTEQQKKNISNSLKGKKYYGKRLSEQHKQKISESKLGKKWSEETRLKMKNRKKHKHTEESKQKMRELALKREETRRQTKLNGG